MFWFCFRFCGGYIWCLTVSALPCTLEGWFLRSFICLLVISFLSLFVVFVSILEKGLELLNCMMEGFTLVSDSLLYMKLFFFNATFFTSGVSSSQAAQKTNDSVYGSRLLFPLPFVFLDPLGNKFGVE